MGRWDTGRLETNDGVVLNFTDSGGEGVPLVMLHGWGQTRSMFRGQLEGLSADRRIITVDLRGHGESEKPRHGYRIARLAADLRDVLDHFTLGCVDLLGWSMGASVLWSYVDIFGSSRVRSLILVDQPATVVAVPWMTPTDQTSAGSILAVDALVSLAHSMAVDPDGNVVRDFVRGMFTGTVDDDLWAFIAEEVSRTPSYAAVPLLFDHATQDWRDVLPLITVPTLVIGCEGSHVSPQSQLYVASSIPGAEVHIFPPEVANSHFPFLENPDAFNAVLTAFLERTPKT